MDFNTCRGKVTGLDFDCYSMEVESWVVWKQESGMDSGSQVSDGLFSKSQESANSLLDLFSLRSLEEILEGKYPAHLDMWRKAQEKQAISTYLLVIYIYD